MDGIYSRLANAVDELYPQRPDPLLPRSLPLERYTGTFYHAGYGSVTLQLAPSTIYRSANMTTLVADLPDLSWKLTMNFEHVSGEYWVVYLNSSTVRNGLMDEAMPAQFRIGSDGNVKSLVVEMQYMAENMLQGLIEFEKLVEPEKSPVY